MSKTIRRKHVHHSLNFLRGAKKNFKTGEIYTDEEADWKYHRDTKTGYGWNGNAPKSFNKMLNRIKRSKMKAEVRKMMVSGNFDNYQFDKWVRDSGWYYW